VRGVKFPAYMDQIDFPYFKRFTEKKLFPQKAAPQKIYVDQLLASVYGSIHVTFD
jgi:hypothetical protein